METLKDGAGTTISVKLDGDTYFEATARQRAKCHLCRQPIEIGKLAWRPLGNGANRARRVCVTCVRKAP